MARDLHIPPWQIEDECSQAWWVRYWVFIKNTNKAVRNQIKVK
jgi:hypothetical protein